MIAGGGIVGLSCALALRGRGHTVAVFERDTAMREASWAAAGMLAAHDPENSTALLPLAERSITLYPEYLAEVERLADKLVPFRTSRTLQSVGLDAFAHGFGTPICARDARVMVPRLQTDQRTFLALAEQSLDPRDLCLALPLAARAAGVAVHEGIAVASVRSRADGVEIRTAEGFTRADAFLNCCGAWAGELMPLNPRGQRSSVHPRKGQMAVVRLREPASLPLVLRSPEIYLVPRGDGRVVVGATVEDAGFSKSVSESALRELIAKAAALWPPIADGEIVDSWAGLRPGTHDALPVLGASGQPHCFIAAGHFRNGILLAPGTAEAVAALIAGEAPAVNLDIFRPDRFTRAA